jgi:O-antigen/teichoic acid export membrane protein
MPLTDEAHEGRAAEIGGWIRNIGSGYLDSLVGGLVFLVLTPALIHELGVESYALWVLSHTITYYIGFFDLGVGSAQVRYQAWFAARNRHNSVRRLTTTVCVLLTLAGIAGALVTLGISTLAPASWLEVSATAAADFPLLMLVLAVNLLVAMPASAIENIYEGAQRYDLRNLRSAGISVITAGVQLYLLFRGHGLVTLAIVELLACCAQLLFDLIVTNRLVPRVLNTPARFERRVWRRIRPFALWSSLDEVLVEGTPHLDRLLVALLLPLALLTPYSLATALAGVLAVVVHPFVEPLLPFAADLHAKPSSGSMARLLLLATRAAVALSAPLAILLVFFGDPALLLWVGEAESSGTQTLIPIVILDAFISMFLWPGGLLLMAMNRMRTIVLLTVAEIAVALALVWILTPRMALSGLALGVLIANVSVGLALQVPLLCKALKLSLLDFLNQTLTRLLLASIPAVVVALALKRSVPCESWAQVIGCMAAVGIVYAVTVLAIGVTAVERRDLWAMARRGLR